MAETLADVLDEIAEHDRRIEELSADRARLVCERVILNRKACRAFRQSIPQDMFVIDKKFRYWTLCPIRNRVISVGACHAEYVPIRADRERDSDSRPLRVPAGDIPSCDGSCAACISGGHCADR